MILQQDDAVLFLGDSITDAGSRAPDAAPDRLGRGYVRLCAERLRARFPAWNLSFANRGVSAHRACDLEARLGDDDVRSLAPTLVSVLVGINDTWRRYDRQAVSPVPAFADTLRRVTATLRERWRPRLVLMEPFLLPVPEDRRAWREDLDPRLAAVREVAVEAGAALVPLDGVFAAAACRREAAVWLPDGVHPSPAGAALIADAWIETVTRD